MESWEQTDEKKRWKMHEGRGEERVVVEEWFGELNLR